jgi:hypothetical protein
MQISGFEDARDLHRPHNAVVEFLSTGAWMNGMFALNTLELHSGPQLTSHCAM